MKNNLEYTFQSTQKYLNLFIFFLVFTGLKIAGVSFSFFIFLFLIYFITVKNNIKLFKIDSLSDMIIIFFFIFIFLSFIFQEEPDTDKNPFSNLKLVIQYLYWLILALYIKTWISKYDFYSISKYFFIGILFMIFYYYTLQKIYFVYPQNFFTFILVITYPLAFYYMNKKFSLVNLVFFSFIIFLAALMSQSRTGAVLVFLEMVLLLSLFNSNIKKIAITLTLIFSFFFISVYSTNQIEPIKKNIASVIEKYNPELAFLIMHPEIVNESDKSLLIRKLMVQKAFKVFEEHPFFGVGIGNFRDYYVKLNIFSKHLYMGEKSYNTRSPQNSFLQILAENGIFALALIILIFTIFIIKGLKNFLTFEINRNFLIYLSILGFISYSFIMAVINGAITWFLIGLGLSMIKKEQK